MTATGLIAEDEPLLAASLKATLAKLWPQLRIVATVTHGAAAVEQALAHQPDIIFLDIRMPGLSGLEAAELLAEDWPGETPLPLIVFVTAYDQYALRAFDHAAVDYVLKPVEVDRLAVTCRRLQAALAARNGSRPAEVPDDLLAALAALRAAEPPAPRLRVLQASQGATIHMIPIAEVLYFEAADKYIKVVTAAREYLVRMPLRQLLPQLDPEEFWQVHRATVVRADAIATATRDETGRVELTLKGHPARLAVSRLHGHLFRGM
ncbi:MAG: response regulator transcription factor [Proteobacteria bacterium]|nr:response regulator transcription factor [Pseudomonadota bacterium]